MRFADALRPLLASGKLGAVLMQYPEWFVPDRNNRAQLATIREQWADIPVCVEFRSRSWLATPKDRDRTLRMLQDLHSGARRRRRSPGFSACRR